MNRSIKLSILYNFIISIALSMISTLFIFLVAFILMHIISYKYYVLFLNSYNNNMKVMLGTILIFVILFIALGICIFYIKMDKMTNYIKIITDNIHEIAKGDFNKIIPIKNDNELGKLAKDINIMSCKINEYIQNEKRWNEERYNMITNLSHDLKTPIMSINGYAQLIKNQKYENNEELNIYSDIISRKSIELNIAINQILELSRLSAADFKINKTSLKLREFIEQVFIEFIPEFEKEGMEYRIDMLENIFIEADTILLIRVFENIITNTLKYAKEGKYLDINGVKSGDKTNIYFINYGPKIADKDLHNIFNKYYREDKNIKNEGNGLGLAIVKTIIELHNGDLKVESNEEQTVFTITI